MFVLSSRLEIDELHSFPIELMDKILGNNDAGYH